MGTEYKLHCSKCGYNMELSLGVGFMYPQFYVEMQEKGKLGELGKEIKEFFDEYPSGVIDPVSIILQCEKCGEYETAPSLNMYILDESKPPRRKNNIRWSVAMSADDVDYIPLGNFKANYKLRKEHQHRCKRCGGKMKVFLEDDLANLKCPRCKEQVLTPEILACWD